MMGPLEQLGKIIIAETVRKNGWATPRELRTMEPFLQPRWSSGIQLLGNVPPSSYFTVVGTSDV